MGANRTNFSDSDNEGAQMSNELESDKAMVAIGLWSRFIFIGADGGENLKLV
jgi:hypothetical protein